MDKQIRAYNVGLHAETVALEYLMQHNLRLLERNFHSRFGEIDLIMHDDSNDTLVFVEVRKRNTGVAAAIESISYAKQQKLLKAAKYYLLKLGRDVNCRFDAVVMGNETTAIQWLRNIIST